MLVNGRLRRIAGKTAFAAAVAVLSAANFAFLAAGDPVSAAPTAAATAHVTKLQFAVVRVTVSAGGHLEGQRLAYHSGDPAFDQAAMRAVAKTAFVSNSRTAGPSTFDYVLLLNADGTRATRILGHLRGDRDVSTLASVHVAPSGDPWTAENDRRISAK